MGFRWRKSFRIFPGLRLNLSHRGARAQIGGSPLSFSFRLFGGSRQRRLTASLPGTGLSFVAVSHPGPDQAQPAEVPATAAADPKAVMREAFAQAAQFRLVPVAFEQIARQPEDARREIVRSAIPIFIRLMRSAGHERAAHERAADGAGAETVDALPAAGMDDLIAEVTGVEPYRRRNHARRAACARNETGER